MTIRNVLLVFHIFGAILLIGPITVATSIFPRHALAAVADVTERGAVRLAHRITSGYGLASLVVPALGGALAGQSNLWGARWLQVAIAVYVCALTVLLLVIVPHQRRVVVSINAGECKTTDIAADIKVLRSTSGIFSLLWLGVLILMVNKPW
jgi:MFS family permease